MKAGTGIFMEKENITGKIIELHGHVYALRRMGSLAFLVLRMRAGLMQIVVEEPCLLEQLETVASEMPVRVKTRLRASAESGRESDLEHIALAIEILGKGAGTLPVEIAKQKRMDALSLNSLLEYRPLTLRNEKVRAIFKIQAELCRAFREFLQSEEFSEIHSPKIVATGTEGGASLFKLDYFGSTAYLAQSPQFYKQIMVGVFERVFEIGPVYRAEEHNTARHLNEYLSMDFEMGFINSEEDLINMQIRLLRHMFESVSENCPAELALFSVKMPSLDFFPKLKLEEAVKILSEKLSWKTASEDLDPEGERLLCEYFEKTEGSPFLYLTHYPIGVRPFYAMPEKGSGKSHSFDLLFRGLEITTGGQRIHDYDELVSAIESRNMQPEKFKDYLQCFKYAMPPHGGLAIGLERLCKQMLGLKNVREAALFPRDRSRISP